MSLCSYICKVSVRVYKGAARLSTRVAGSSRAHMHHDLFRSRFPTHATQRTQLTNAHLVAKIVFNIDTCALKFFLSPTTSPTTARGGFARARRWAAASMRTSPTQSLPPLPGASHPLNLSQTYSLLYSLNLNAMSLRVSTHTRTSTHTHTLTHSLSPPLSRSVSSPAGALSLSLCFSLSPARLNGSFLFESNAEGNSFTTRTRGGNACKNIQFFIKYLIYIEFIIQL